jgi:hypothetical protein
MELAERGGRRGKIRRMPFLRRACGLLAICVFAAAAPAGDDPQDVVERFYTAYIAARPAGLPDGEELARLAPFLSARLHALIVDALQHRDESIRRHPDAKPPFVDGDHFTSLFEGPRAFEIVRVDGGHVHVRFTDAWS